MIADQSGHNDLATGNPVDIVISADRLNLCSLDFLNSSFPNEADSSPNKYRCKLISEEFIGAIVTLLVETENGTELKIQKQQKDLDKDLNNVNLETGQPLWVSWPEENVYIVPTNQSAKFAFPNSPPNSPPGPPPFSTG